MNDLLFIIRSRSVRWTVLAAAVGASVVFVLGLGSTLGCDDVCSCLGYNGSSSSSSSYMKASEAYGKIPLSFEANRGQIPGDYNYLARGANYDAFFAPQGVLIALHQQPDGTPGRQIRVKFTGSSTPAPQGFELLPARANYFIGNQPSRWVTDVRSFARLRYPA
ncbi:MAG: hypothetical protein ABI165_16295, partial [Bryobacteraceae bacterium]